MRFERGIFAVKPFFDAYARCVLKYLIAFFIDFSIAVSVTGILCSTRNGHINPELHSIGPFCFLG